LFENKKVKILDLACGHGRHVVELSKRGYDVVGIDKNSLFLDEARKSASRNGVKIRLIKTDIRKINFKSEFDCVVCMSCAFGYFSDDDNFRVIKKADRALKIDGKLFLDIDNREIIPGLAEQVWKESPDGSKILIKRRFNLKTVN